MLSTAMILILRRITGSEALSRASSVMNKLLGRRYGQSQQSSDSAADGIPLLEFIEQAEHHLSRMRIWTQIQIVTQAMMAFSILMMLLQ